MQEIIKKYNLPLLKFNNVTRHLLYQDVSSCNIFNNMLWLQVYNTWPAWYKYSTSPVAALPISVITKLGYILLHFSFPLAKGQTILYFDSFIFVWTRKQTTLYLPPISEPEPANSGDASLSKVNQQRMRSGMQRTVSSQPKTFSKVKANMFAISVNLAHLTNVLFWTD